ncbi:MAG: hypothetical protein KJO21_10195 [Verrucomicrobiae bacterium]|nr:hypothetical protein [Verrucomicrobiae bacterium]NNJ43831.1 hypothetical protein [Akkermansiaceae bacterium]
MKAVIYIVLVMGALLLPASKFVRDSAIVFIKAMATGIERLVIRGDYAEIRLVDGDEFNEVIHEPGRLVIMSVQKEMTASSRSEVLELDQAIKRLPAKVLVAKVIAEQNAPLLAELNIPRDVPTMRIYSRGKMVKEFQGSVDKDKFLRVVQYHLDNPNVKIHGDAFMGPMHPDWMPEGVEARGKKVAVPVTPLE